MPYVVLSGANLPCVLRASAPFADVRFHGPERQHPYAGSYSDADVDWWVEHIREWEYDGRRVFADFNHDGRWQRVLNARALRHRLGRSAPPT